MRERARLKTGQSLKSDATRYDPGQAASQQYGKHKEGGWSVIVWLIPAETGGHWFVFVTDAGELAEFAGAHNLNVVGPCHLMRCWQNQDRLSSYATLDQFQVQFRTNPQGLVPVIIFDHYALHSGPRFTGIISPPFVSGRDKHDSPESLSRVEGSDTITDVNLFSRTNSTARKNP